MSENGSSGSSGSSGSNGRKDTGGAKGPAAKPDWRRRSALFDEAAELEGAARTAWLARLASDDPAMHEVIVHMLADLDAATNPGATDQVSIAGIRADAFEGQLDAATVPAMKQSEGDAVGPWRLTRKIGEGGMGAVWLAERRDGHFESRAAIKFLRAGLVNTEAVGRFLRERRLLARLAHPGIARLLDAGTHEGEPYLVMEHIDGAPITEWAAAHAPRVADRVALMLKVCRALEHAHGQLIVHRDLKPSNVLVNAAGEPALLDFGVAKLIDHEDEESATALTRMTGRGFTLGYCAPEQITGEPTGVAADVFSAGVLLFELLSGSLPFKPARDGRAALEHAIVHEDARSLARVLDQPEEAPRKDASQNRRPVDAALGTRPNDASPGSRPIDAAKARGDLEAIVARALRKNPADRYPTISAFADDLSRWQDKLPVQARRGNWQYKTALWFGRNRALASVAGAAFVAVSAGLVLALWQADRANDEAARADSARATEVEQRRRAEIATSQATAALAESEQAKIAAVDARREAVSNAASALQNERRSREAESATAVASRRALAEAAKARAVNQYLVALFDGADPERAKGEKLTAREILDTGAKTLATQFADDAETRAELQAVLGRTYMKLSLPQTAVPLLKDAAAAAEKKFGAGSLEHSRIAYSLALAEMEAEDYPACEAHYRKALPALARADGFASEANVVGSVVLAYCLQKQGKFAEIDPLIAPVREAVLKERGDQDWLYAEVENSRAAAAGAQGKVGDEHRILAAIEPLLKTPPPGKRSDALMIRNNLAVTLGRIGRVDDSLVRLEPILAEWNAHLGPDAELTLKAQWFFGEMLRQAGRYTECGAQYASLAAARERVTGPAHALTLDVYSKAAMCAQLSGDERRAADFAARALAGLPATDQPPQRTVLRTLQVIQVVALDSGEKAPAAASAARTRALFSALSLPLATPEGFFMVGLEASEIARTGDTKAALVKMEPLVAPAYKGVISARLMHAYLLVLDGQLDRARSELKEIRVVAQARHPAGHPYWRTLDYVDALAARPQDGAAAVKTLETRAGRTARLPLAPNWFGF